MIQTKARVAIGMPVYNGERFVAEALDALLAQTFTDYELIICDNASTDRTGQICRSYAAKDERIGYFRNEMNIGAAKNYRWAFELSSGQYFKWSTCDDLCGPEFLARCVEVLDQDPSVVLAYPKTKLIDERGKLISDYEDGLHIQATRASERFRRLFQRLRLCNALYGLIRADLLKKTALMGNYIGADIALLAELTLYGKFWEIPEFLFYRRFHPGASSSYKEVSQLQEFYDPKIKHKIPLTEWRHHWEYFRSVARAPVAIPEKIRLATFIARAGIWNRAKLGGELSMAMRRAIRRILAA